MSVKTVTAYGQKPDGSRVPLPVTEDGKLDVGLGDSENPVPVSLATALAGLVAGVENDTILTAPFRRADAWQDFGTDADLTTQEVVQAGVASKKIYITDIVISVDDEMDITLQDEDDAQVFPLLQFPGKGIFSKKLETPVELATNKDLEIKSSGAGTVSWGLLGYQI